MMGLNGIKVEKIPTQKRATYVASIYDPFQNPKFINDFS
jgi:ABC-type uncharacterized transport system ATPase component